MTDPLIKNLQQVGRLLDNLDTVVSLALKKEDRLMFITYAERRLAELKDKLGN